MRVSDLQYYIGYCKAMGKTPTFSDLRRFSKWVKMALIAARERTV